MINSNLTKKSESPSSLNSPLGSAACNKQEPSSFEWAPSVQSDLFNYLKPHQKAALKPYLRLIKRDYQEKLCISLLDYLEGHGLDTFTEPVLGNLNVIFSFCREIIDEKKNFCLVTNPRNKLIY